MKTIETTMILVCVLAFVGAGMLIAPIVTKLVKKHIRIKKMLVDVTELEEFLTKEEIYKKGKCLEDIGNTDKALGCYIKSAEMGCDKACLILAYKYLNGDLVKKNIDIADYYFIRASKLGNKQAEKYIFNEMKEK